MKLSDLKVGERYLAKVNRSPGSTVPFGYSTDERTVTVLAIGVHLTKSQGGPWSQPEWGWVPTPEQIERIPKSARRVAPGGRYVHVQIGESVTTYVMPGSSIIAPLAEVQAKRAAREAWSARNREIAANVRDEILNERLTKAKHVLSEILMQEVDLMGANPHRQYDLLAARLLGALDEGSFLDLTFSKEDEQRVTDETVARLAGEEVPE